MVTMPRLRIRGIEIDFPYEPYDVQLAYMEKVIECLQTSRNGILESPTGTGKTLCLLTASLAWLLFERQSDILDNLDNAEENLDLVADITNNIDGPSRGGAGASNVDAEDIKKQKPRLQIIYASRTHTQLQQVLNELKTSVYADQVKSCVLASRLQLCIHDTARSARNNESMSNSCRRLVANFEAMQQSKNCAAGEPLNYCDLKCKAECYNGVSEERGVHDVEDLIKIGKSNKCCPFFLSKRLKNGADIVFVPYNYILDPSIRHNLLSIKGRVLIVDEAHNISRICEEMSSLELKESNFTRGIEEVTLVENSISKEPSFSPAATYASKFSTEDLDELKRCLGKLEIEMQGMRQTTLKSTHKRTFVLNFFEKADLHEDNYWKMLTLLEAIIQYSHISPVLFDKAKSNVTATNLQKVQSVINTVFEGLTCPEEELSFKVHITKTVPAQRTSAITPVGESCLERLETTMHYYCLDPAVNMRRLCAEEPRCLLFTSGTLSPTAYFISELGLDESCVTLENKHIINDKQLFVGVLSTGPDNFPLESTFKLRDNPDYIRSLGRTIQAFAKSVPGGVLVFFPTYNSMHSSVGQWREHGLPIFDGNAKQKHVFIESRDKEAFEKSIFDYYQKIDDEDSGGAIFMGVCKGKVSEGIDFADNRGRAVFVTGLPFPPKHEAVIELKREYLKESHARNRKEITDSEWYTLEAIRPVNQAIGRIIRHKNDYGAIIFCDKRYSEKRLQKFLPQWLRDQIVIQPYGKLRKAFIDFMRSETHAAHMPVPMAPQITPVSKIIEEGTLGNSLQPKRSGEDNGEEVPKKMLRAKKDLLPLFSGQHSEFHLQCSTVSSTSNHGSFALLMKQVARYSSKEEQDLVLNAFMEYEQSGKRDFNSLFPKLSAVLFHHGALNGLMPVICSHLKRDHAVKLRSICNTLGLQLEEAHEDVLLDHKSQ